MVRLLHVADVHLDTAFEGRSSSLRTHLRSALRSAFERAVDCAIDENVDAVLIAGDLFDDERLSVTTEDFLVDQVHRLHRADVTVVYTTGNHDPGASDFRASKIDWPEGVHYVDERQPTRIPIEDADGTVQAVVVAAGHESPREQENLVATFPDPQTDVPHVGVVHAHVTSAAEVDAHDRYAPCTLDDLRAAGYDYWALGHVHTRQQVCERPAAWYAGNLQGRTPRETGARGGLLVTIGPEREPQVEFRSFAPTRWEQLTVTGLDDVETVRALIRRVRSQFDEDVRDRSAIDWLLRVNLVGPCPLAADLSDPDRVEELESVATDRLDVLDVEIRTQRLAPPVNVDAFRDETHLAGEVLSLLERAREDDSFLDEVAPDVLGGVSTGDEELRLTYLRSLLDGLDREAVARMVDEEGWNG